MNPPSALVRLHQAATRSRTLRYQQRRTRLESERARRDDVAYGDLLATARAVSRGDELAGLLALGFNGNTAENGSPTATTFTR